MFPGYIRYDRPRVGEPATLVYPQDRYPLIITHVSETGYKIVLRELNSDGLLPVARINGFPVFDHVYTAEELITHQTTCARNLSAYRHADGNYYVGGCTPIWLGQARYRRDFSD